MNDTQFPSSFAIASTGCFASAYCATTSGNAGLKQTFAGVSTSSIEQVSFEVNGGGVNAYDFFYTDGSSDDFVAFSDDGSYSSQNVTADLRQGATLTGFEIFGADGSATTLDNISIVANAPLMAATPEPSSLALLGTGLLCVVGVMRKRFA